MSEFVERRIVSLLVSRLKRAGWKAVCVYDGMEYVPTKTAKAVLETVFSVDESTLTVEKNSQRKGILLVLGNGADVICDYNTNTGTEDFEGVMSGIEDHISETYQ